MRGLAAIVSDCARTSQTSVNDGGLMLQAVMVEMVK
jgi:hypothetical protein